MDTPILKEKWNLGKEFPNGCLIDMVLRWILKMKFRRLIGAKEGLAHLALAFTDPG